MAVRCSRAARSGPDYRRPDFRSPASYEYLPKDVADTINTEWWKQFGDPVLDQLIAEALANNKNVKQAAANVQQAAALLTETQSQFYPQVGYDAGGTRQQFSTDFLPNRPEHVAHADHLQRHRAAPAGRSTCGAASAGRPKRRRPTCSPPTRRAAA